MSKKVADKLAGCNEGRPALHFFVAPRPVFAWTRGDKRAAPPQPLPVHSRSRLASVCSLSRAGAHGPHAPLSLASTARPAQLPPTPSPPPPWLHSRRPSRPTPLPRHRLHPQLLQLRLHPQQLRLPQQHLQLRLHPQQLRLPQQHPLHRQLRLPQQQLPRLHPLQLPRLQQAPTPWFPVTPSR